MSHGSATTRRLLLASRSPRRRQMLAAAAIPHEMIDTGVDDAQLEPGAAGLTNPAIWATALAYLKARAALDSSAPTDLILAADTICVMDGAIIGQPRDDAQAAAMILGFLGREHDVLTGVCLLCPATGARTLFHDAAIVRLGHVSVKEISAYIASGQWRGKAGGYNFFERRDAGWPLRVEGDPDTVVGLPIRLVKPIIDAHLAMESKPFGARP